MADTLVLGAQDPISVAQLVDLRDRLISAARATHEMEGARIARSHSAARAMDAGRQPNEVATALEQWTSSLAERRRTTTDQCDLWMRIAALREVGDLAAAQAAYETALDLAQGEGPETRDRESIIRSALAIASLQRRRRDFRHIPASLRAAAAEIPTAYSETSTPRVLAERLLALVAEGRTNDAEGELADHRTSEHWTETATHFAAGIVCAASGAGSEARARMADAVRVARSEPTQTPETMVHAIAGAVGGVALAHDGLIPGVAELGAIADLLDALGAETDVYTRESPVAIEVRALRHWLLELTTAIDRDRDQLLLALRLTATVKQTGVASFIRRGHVRRPASALRRKIESALQDLHSPPLPGVATDGLGFAEPDADPRTRLEHTVSAAFANLASPRPLNAAAIDAMLRTAAGSHVLEYVSTGTDEPRWIRIWIRPDGTGTVEELDHVLVNDIVAQVPMTLRGEGHQPALAWRLLGEALVPAELWTELAATPRSDPIDVVVIPFGPLAVVPWSALRSAGLRCLIDHAVIRSLPTMVVLDLSPRQEQQWRQQRRKLTAAVRLVEEEVDVTAERHFWATQGVDVLDEPAFRAKLNDTSGVGIVQVSTHGDGEGLRQRISLPGLFDAIDALLVDWPSTVLFLACNVGRPVLDELDMSGMVISCLVRGAREIVSGLHLVNDAPTGVLGAALLERIHAEPDRSVAALLRETQLDLLDDAIAPGDGRDRSSGWRPVASWGLLACQVDSI